MLLANGEKKWKEVNKMTGSGLVYGQCPFCHKYGRHYLIGKIKAYYILQCEECGVTFKQWR